MPKHVCCESFSHCLSTSLHIVVSRLPVRTVHSFSSTRCMHSSLPCQAALNTSMLHALHTNPQACAHSRALAMSAAVLLAPAAAHSISCHDIGCRSSRQPGGAPCVSEHVIVLPQARSHIVQLMQLSVNWYCSCAVEQNS